MKVVLVNGSPHKDGCTYTALCEVSEALNEQGIDTDIFWIGKKPLSGCIACKLIKGFVAFSAIIICQQRMCCLNMFVIIRNEQGYFKDLQI